MRQIMFHKTNISTSALGFGCQRVLSTVGTREAQHALEHAFDLGIRHFDLARSYGLGEAEGLVGRFARGRRDQLTIATKFGILPSERASRYAKLKPMVRPLLRQLPRLRAQFGPLTAGGNFDPAVAMKSVETSLLELKTDYIDILLMHECQRGGFDAAEMEDLASELKRTGKIRAFGLATSVEETAAILDAGKPEVDVVQIPRNIFNRDGRRLPNSSTVATILHSVFQLPSDSVVLNVITKIRRILLDAGFDPTNRDVWRELSLAHACHTNPAGVVVCSMFQTGHAIRNAEIASGHVYSHELLAAIQASLER
jgi:D-threo-aldose 1-dehydrogenase